MNNDLTIRQNFLAAISEALGERASDLQQHIRKIAQHDCINETLRIGQSIYPNYHVDMRRIDAEAILSELKNVEIRRGYNFTFGGCQVNLLISVWSRIVRGLQAEEQNTTATLQDPIGID